MHEPEQTREAISPLHGEARLVTDLPLVWHVGRAHLGHKRVIPRTALFSLSCQ